MTKHYDVIHTETGGLIGSISLKQPGWFFISNVSSHQGSRAGHATAEKAFPARIAEAQRSLDAIALERDGKGGRR